MKSTDKTIGLTLPIRKTHAELVEELRHVRHGAQVMADAVKRLEVEAEEARQREAEEELQTRVGRAFTDCPRRPPGEPHRFVPMSYSIEVSTGASREFSAEARCSLCGNCFSTKWIGPR